MALDFGGGNSGFRHTEVVQFINSEILMNGGGPEFYVAFSSLSWKEVEDQLRLVVANPQMPHCLKRAYAWSSLALGVKASVRHCEQQERCVQRLQDQIEKHEVASWALISQVQKLREERNEAAAQLLFTQTALRQAMEEREALRNRLLQAEKSAQDTTMAQDTELGAQAVPLEAAVVLLNADQQTDVGAVGASGGPGAMVVHDRQNLEAQTPAPIPVTYMSDTLSSWTSVVQPVWPLLQPVAPQGMVPQSIISQPMSSQSFIPQKIAPQPTDAQPTDPQPIAPQPISPQLLTPQPAEPHLIASPLEPQPVSPQPMEPHLISFQPIDAQPIALQSMEPHLIVPQSIVPQPDLTQPIFHQPICMPYHLPLYPSFPMGVPFVQPHLPAVVTEAASGVLPLHMPPVGVYPHGLWAAEGFQGEMVTLCDQRCDIQVEGLENLHSSFLQGDSKSEGQEGSEKPQGPYLQDNRYLNQAEHAETFQGMDPLEESGLCYQEEQNPQGMIPLGSNRGSQNEGSQEVQGMASLEVTMSGIQERSADIVQGMVDMKVSHGQEEEESTVQEMAAEGINRSLREEGCTASTQRVADSGFTNNHSKEESADKPQETLASESQAERKTPRKKQEKKTSQEKKPLGQFSSCSYKTDWFCSWCKGINFAWRSACYKCKKVRKQVERGGADSV
ncbi:testis-expressed protein 13D [Perognathus longimembris pacificus]|uniref:testis-expressed protein 13D n=1 Tax=Perognathus longimembris pacificus TaxID=214514 RepID=UPI002019F168|nr:testis-expressed protein 13D [Perognathus longimembris pacificus]